MTKLLALALTGACGGSPPPAAAPQTTATAATPAASSRKGLQIGLTSVYVDDQAKALRFYTEVLGFVIKDDVTNEGFRWITVTASEDPGGTQLQLALDTDPAAKAFAQAKFKNNEPAIMFYTDDVQGNYDRIKAAGGEFTMPPTDVTYATIAMLKDTCGNLVQITQLER